MRTLLAVFLTVAVLGNAHAASLYWDTPVSGDVNVEYSDKEAGPYTVLSTIPSIPAVYPLTPGKFGYYRLTQFAFTSNVVRFTSDITNDLETKVDQILTILQTPAGNLKATIVDADHMQISGVNCTSLKTTGSGLTRTLTCVH